MTKAELIERVCKEAGPTVSKKTVTTCVEAVFSNLERAIRRDKKFTYPGFGCWQVKKRKARKGRNPRTGDIISIPPHKTVSFKPAPALKETL